MGLKWQLLDYVGQPVSLREAHVFGKITTVVVQAEHAKFLLSPPDNQVVRVHVDESNASKMNDISVHGVLQTQRSRQAS